jgi:hypothetical protein
MRRNGIGTVKLLCFAYWILRRIFRAIIDDGLDNFKAHVFVAGAEMFAILTVMSSVDLLVGRRVMSTSRAGSAWLGYGLATVIVIANQSLFSKNRMARFESEFSGYSTRSRTIGGITVVSVMALLVVAAIFAGMAASRLPR